jgi:hypothetical protein
MLLCPHGNPFRSSWRIKLPTYSCTTEFSNGLSQQSAPMTHYNNRSIHPSIFAMSLMSSYGAFFAQHKDLERTLDFARDIHEAQLRLKDTNPRSYDASVHAGILAFHLRTISRKADGLVIELDRRLSSGRRASAASKRTSRLRNALREYSASVAGADPWDIVLSDAVAALELAFDCLESVDADISGYEQLLGQPESRRRSNDLR